MLALFCDGCRVCWLVGSIHGLRLSLNFCNGFSAVLSEGEVQKRRVFITAMKGFRQRPLSALHREEVRFASSTAKGRQLWGGVFRPVVCSTGRLRAVQFSGQMLHIMHKMTYWTLFLVHIVIKNKDMVQCVCDLCFSSSASISVSNFRLITFIFRYCTLVHVRLTAVKINTMNSFPFETRAALLLS